MQFLIVNSITPSKIAFILAELRATSMLVWCVEYIAVRIVSLIDFLSKLYLPPMTDSGTVSILAVSLSLFTERAHPSKVPLPNKKKAQAICLLEASRKTPRAHVLRNGSGMLLLITTPVNGKSITAATYLTRIARAFDIVMRGRNGLCASNRDVSTI